MYLLSKHNVSEKIIEDAHLQTLHGGVGLTMSMVRDHIGYPSCVS